MVISLVYMLFRQVEITSFIKYCFEVKGVLAIARDPFWGIASKNTKS